MNRRDFLKTVALASFSSPFMSIRRLLAQDVALDPNSVAFFSDLHLKNPESIQQVVRFKQCVAKILAMNPRPANLLIYGDVVYDHGTVEAYQVFRKLIEPIEKAGIHWELTMGNHDRIDDYRQVFPERFSAQPIKGRYINIVQTPYADFILLDSYLEGEVRGEICQAQQEWLQETLKNYSKKPVFVGCHHQIENTQIGTILKSSPSFIAYLHGHRHYYRTPELAGVKTICFPSTGHWGDMGFVTAHITAKEAIFVPEIDAYQWSKYGYIKEPEKNVENYITQLNKHVVSFKFPQ